ADDHGAVVVLERAGDDLGSAGRLLVDEDDEGDVGRDGDRVRDVDPFEAALPLLGDGGAAWEEDPGDVDRLVDDPAAVAAQVEDDPARAPVEELRDRDCRLLRGGLVELKERDVSDPAVDEHREGDGGDMDDGAGQSDLEGLVDPRASDLDLDDRPRLALEPAGDLVERPPRDRLTVERKDEVSRH